jgi:hypothetical protein
MMVLHRPVQRLATTRLLALHAAIRVYRAQNGRLPKSLPVLNLGAMATDPFTDASFRYQSKPDGTFTLDSPGPFAVKEGEIDKATRTRFYLGSSLKTLEETL